MLVKTKITSALEFIKQRENRNVQVILLNNKLYQKMLKWAQDVRCNGKWPKK